MTIMCSWYIFVYMREKYDYLGFISTVGLEKQFHYYCKRHKNIKSLNRLGRYFLCSLGYTRRDFANFLRSQWSLEETIRIAKLPWVD